MSSPFQVMPVGRNHLLTVLFFSFFFFGHARCRLRDLRSPTRDRNRVPAVKALSPNHSTAREFPTNGSWLQQFSISTTHTFVNWNSTIRKSCLFDPIYLFSYLVTSTRTHGYLFYLTLWVTHHSYYLFWCPDHPSHGHWRYFELTPASS